MALRTVTYDTATHKIVPIEPTDDILTASWGYHDSSKYLERVRPDKETDAECYQAMIAAAPEYQDKTADLESRDFYEIMYSYRTELIDAAKQFEAVKAWLRNPVYEYQEPTKDE